MTVVKFLIPRAPYGARGNKGIRFSTNSFSLNEVKFLSQILEDKYNFNTTIHKTGDINQYNVYVTKESTPPRGWASPPRGAL